MNIALSLVTSLCYAALSLIAWYQLPKNQGWSRVERIAFIISIVIHTAALFFAMHFTSGIKLGFAQILSLTTWVGLLIFMLENRLYPIFSLRLLLLPFASLTSLLCAILPAPDSIPPEYNMWFIGHLFLSVVAFSLMFICFCHAWMVTLLNRQLHAIGKSKTPTWMNALLQQLPPLLILERIFFRLLLLGFVTLTFAILTGAGFSLVFHHRFLSLDHKTVFTLTAWLIFAILLAGHLSKGWRGKDVMRWSITAFSLLVLAYAGSRFVLEVLLHRPYPF